MTVRLYDTDAYLKEFDSEVISCTEGKNGYEIILKETAFFPEGGGQPADTGWLDGARVLDARDRGEEIIHICDRPLEPERHVHGKIDWERRFLHMQQHSGEHIFSGIVHGIFGYDNIGFHMGKDYVTVDFSGLLTQEETDRVERETNAVIFSNVEIRAEYPSREELAALSYRSKKELEGAVRIVTVPGADVCACCGTHVRRTGEIGLVKVTSSEHYKSGVRLTLQIGWKALEDYDRKHRNVKAVSALLSARPEEIGEAVKKQQEQLLELKNANVALKQKLFDFIVENTQQGMKQAILFEPGLNSVEVRQLADRLAEKAELAAVFSGDRENGYRYVMCSSHLDVAALGKQFNQEFHGKGGGRNPMIQGSVEAEEDAVRAFFDKL